MIEIKDGYARIVGRTLKAERVARMHVDAEAPIDEVMAHCGLTRAEVYAALAYYYENQALLDHAYAAAIQQGRDRGAVDSATFKAEINQRRHKDTN